MKARVVKEFSFEAAHRIPRHLGKCQAVHGHSFRVQVQVYGEVCPPGSSQEGMVVDFSVLGEVWRRQASPQLDHRYLNEEVPELKTPTAENIAAFVLNTFASALNSDRYYVEAVRVWEQTGSYAEVCLGDL